MPGTITTDQVTIEDAEVVADYLVLGTFASAQALNDDIKVQGANAINGRVSANSAWSLALTAAGLDLTVTDRHVWMWLRVITWPSADTKANGALGISISSDVTPTLTGTTPSNGPTNSKTWYLAGSDTESITGWSCYCVDPNGTADLTLGTPVMSSVDRIGLRCKITGAVSNKTLNVHHDVVRYGTGLTVKDGTTGAPAAMVDVFTTDTLNANAWGVVTRQAGIYFLAGKLYIGTTGQTAVTVFADTTQVYVWQNYPVSSTLYEFRLAGTASFATTFQLGTFSGGLAAGGVTIKGAGSGSTHAVWTLTASAANTLCKLYGSTFSELLSAALRTDSEVKFCTFTNFASITPSGAAIEDCTFQDVKTTAPISGVNAVILNATTDVADMARCKFINCNRAIRITVAGTYSFVGMTFSGNTFDIENTSNGAVIINCSNGSNPVTHTSTGAGSVTINNNVGVTLTGLKDNTEVRVYTTGTTTELAGIEDATSGTVDNRSFTFSLSAGVVVDVRIHNKTYEAASILAFTIPAADASIPISQRFDRNYSNP